MSRGISQQDVFTACDALVLAGERPTIERVRQKIGRGSPNTVSPMLDMWFKGLGRRLQDPGAFAPPSDIPEPILQAAQHFWEVAQATARGDLEQQVAERLGPLQAEVDRALQMNALVTAEKDAANIKVREARDETAELASRLDAERTAHAAAHARAESNRREIDDLNTRLIAAEAQARDAAERGRAEIQAAHERASGAERRAALEIENERAVRGKADKRADVLEKRVESLQRTSAGQTEELIKTQSALEFQRADANRLRAANEEAAERRQLLDAALIEAKLVIARTEAEAKTTQTAMAQLLPLIADGTARAIRPKTRQSPKRP